MAKRPERAEKRRSEAAKSALGAELKRLRENLGCNLVEMADWLGVSTQRPDGTATATGKSQVWHMEAGSRIPDDRVLAQYGRAPGADPAALQAMRESTRNAVKPAIGVTAVADTENAGFIGLPYAGPASPPAEHDQAGNHVRPDERGRTNVRAKSEHRRVPNRGWVIAATAAVVVSGSGVAVALLATDDNNQRHSSTSPLRGTTFVFDALGPRSDQTINVYAGYRTSKADRQTDMSFHNGDRAEVYCQVQGRRVTSDLGAGERFRSTDMWVRVRSESGLIRYATLTYGRIVPSSAAIPMCR